MIYIYAYIYISKMPQIDPDGNVDLRYNDRSLIIYFYLLRSSSVTMYNFETKHF